MDSPLQNIVHKYRKVFTQYSSFSSRLEILLTDLLEEQGIKKHFSESRAKTPESLDEKLKRPGKSYNMSLDAVPDLAGVRLVLYYEDNVPMAGEIIRDEFEVLEVKGAHQPEVYSPDQFGYLSLHFIVRLNSVRSELPEWKSYDGLRAEIQIRTVLQHSWAAVSHALQYKREGDVPKDLRRKLFRLASLFELADEEFVAIRIEAERIKEEYNIQLSRDMSIVSIDAPSVKNFISNGETMSVMMSELDTIGYVFDEDYSNVGSLVEECERLEMKSMSELTELVNEYRKDYFKGIYMHRWIVDSAFVMLLALIDKYVNEFSKEYLVEHLGWNETIAKKIMEYAGAIDI